MLQSKLSQFIEIGFVKVKKYKTIISNGKANINIKYAKTVAPSGAMLLKYMPYTRTKIFANNQIINFLFFFFNILTFFPALIVYIIVILLTICSKWNTVGRSRLAPLFKQTLFKT